MTPAVATLVLLALKSSVLVGLAALAALALTRASAAARHLAWLAGFGAALALPVVSALFAWLPAAWAPQLASTIAPVAATTRTVLTVTAAAPAWSAAGGLVLIVWTAVASLLLLRAAFAQYRAWRLARQSESWHGFENQCVRLSEDIDVPAVCGLARPVILLPESALDWPADRLELVLRHEAMHAARRDTLSQLVSNLVCALYWPLPWVWFAAARLRMEAELACDDAVLRSGERASDYAGHLIDIVRGLSGRERVPQGGIPMARISDLERRLRAMLNPEMNRRPAGRRMVATAAVAALSILAPLAALRLPASAAAPGSIGGVVRDVSGAAIPRARVTLTFPGSDRKEVTLTDAVGRFNFEPIPDGNYAVRAASPGFALSAIKQLSLAGGSGADIEIMLQPGQVSESLTVSGEGTPKSAPTPSGPPTRIRVGGNVQSTKIVNMVRPVYPPECKAAGIEGTVLMRAVISRDGDIISLQRINQMVDDRIAQAALDAVAKWKYQPTLLNGEPIEVITEIEVNFTLAR
ncbi:M56 family metallopeptidase [uncultured Paludibaculum sp.]|uniref:M56 family metallopeptidase n=1 Tax=uncultured Paludibaculum sp. TaxID=1765020 RepID=UPI002AAAC112|nr:M56 family metallopeptidase [uncultured Paludibaculum sp.]